MRLRYYKRPIEWMMEPTVEQRIVVNKTDLWVLKPGQYELHHCDGRLYMVSRHAHHLMEDCDLIHVHEKKLGLEIGDYIGVPKSERYLGVPVAKYLPHEAGILPGPVVGPEEDSQPA